MEELIEILELSAAKNGKETPITIGHLLNIIKLSQKIKNQREEEQEGAYYEALADSWYFKD